MATAKKTTAGAVATRSILVNRTHDEPLIADGIPRDAKITYGPVQPGKQGYSGAGNALRIYTTANNQLAVFLNVESFRDLSLTVRERKTTTVSEGETVVGPDGCTRKSAGEVSYEWVQVNA